jgi:hypothetical protein
MCRYTVSQLADGAPWSSSITVFSGLRNVLLRLSPNLMESEVKVHDIRMFLPNATRCGYLHYLFLPVVLCDEVSSGECSLVMK